MSGLAQVDHYKQERGLIEVFTNLSGSYRSTEDVATRINISMAKVKKSYTNFKRGELVHFFTTVVTGKVCICKCKFGDQQFSLISGFHSEV